MEENLVIVESPAKAKTIERFLGKEYLVKSSFGHIRDLAKKNLGIEIKKGYKPHYVVSPEKKKVVTELKKLAETARTVWLASDEDREGEAIAWHLAEVLDLKPEKTRRIVFHEITRDAIRQAIEQPRGIDQNLVNAQQARRILDRLVGFELSPILWKKIQPALSAGRVQSVAVRLLVDREREIMQFRPSSSFRVNAEFSFSDEAGKEYRLNAESPSRYPDMDQARNFLEVCAAADFTVSDISSKPSKKSPAPPFTTSTLQQEASRKLGFSVSQTMAVAQRLYEAGKITYMRTDSVNLSGLALGMAKKVIAGEYGEKYLHTRQYKTKSKGAQEAHEAIRPTYLDQKSISGTQTEKRLYDLIWKRTVASQMSDALLEKTTARIELSNSQEKFVATGEVLKFDGFLKVYKESSDEEEEAQGLLPPVRKGQLLNPLQITATERFTQQPPRYTEASLVKKLEELGIGRPSTYAPTISTIQQRGYVVKEDRPGTPRKFSVLRLKDKKISEESRTEMAGSEKGKLFPADIGMLVNDFLVNHFPDIVNYNFTATVEEQFDEIAEGKLNWEKMIDDFYKVFHQKVNTTLEQSEKTTGERLLGKDPVTGLPVSVRIGPYGPMAQLGESGGEDKPRFASLMKNQRIETISLEEALELFKLPRKVGEYEGREITAGVGRFGPYLRYDGKFYSLNKQTDDPISVDLERAITVILEKNEKDLQKTLKVFEEDPDLKILNGRWGPYITYKKENYRIPKGTKAEELSFQECMDLISKGKTKGKKRS